MHNMSYIVFLLILGLSVTRTFLDRFCEIHLNIALGVCVCVL